MSDPSLATLVPTSTTRRNTVLVVAGLLALLLAGLSPQALRPRIFDSGWGGLTGAATDRTLTVVYQDTPHVWPSATIAEIIAPPGTHVVGAWVAETADVIAALDREPGPAATSPTTWKDVIGGSFPEALRVPDNALPQRVSGGTEISLAVVYQIDDCTLVTSALPPAPAGADIEQPFLTFRTVVGTTVTASGRDIGPTSSHAVESLRFVGVCP